MGTSVPLANLFYSSLLIFISLVVDQPLCAAIGTLLVVLVPHVHHQGAPQLEGVVAVVAGELLHVGGEAVGAHCGGHPLAVSCW